MGKERATAHPKGASHDGGAVEAVAELCRYTTDPVKSF